MLNIRITSTNGCNRELTKSCSDHVRITISCEPEFKYPAAEGYNE